MIAGQLLETRDAAAAEATVAVLPLDREGRLACFVSVFLAFLYALALPPALARLGLGCGYSGMAGLGEIAECAIACLLLALAVFLWFARSGAMPAPVARRLVNTFSGLLLTLFAAASTKLAFVYTKHGNCGLRDIFWYAIFLVVTMFASPRVEIHYPKVTHVDAKVQAGRILDGLETVAWSAEDARAVGQDLEAAQCEAQCAICLADWEADDALTITPCKHAFHKECLQTWLTRQLLDRRAVSCALCRHGLGAASGEAQGTDGAGGHQPTRPTSRARLSTPEPLASQGVSARPPTDVSAVQG